MSIQECFFALICTLFVVAVIASYRQIHEYEKLIASLSNRNRRYNQLIARYETAIESLPAHYRNEIVEYIHRKDKH